MSGGDPGTAEPVPGGAPDPVVFHLCLYVAGQTQKSVRARHNLRRLCETYLTGHYTIEVIDLMANPRLASVDEVLAIPTLVRREPPPPRRVIGDLSDTDRVLAGLGIDKGDHE